VSGGVNPPMELNWTPRPANGPYETGGVSLPLIGSQVGLTVPFGPLVADQELVDVLPEHLSEDAWCPESDRGYAVAMARFGAEETAR
jgi:hypothetical protein